MDVSTPAIRGSESLGRLMGLVMMLIRYTMIEILLHMCMGMYTRLYDHALRNPHTHKRD